MPAKTISVELDPNEVALVVGEEDGNMTVRVVPATDLKDETTDIPEPYEIAVALAVRLLEDPEFHDEMLEWYESRDELPEDDDGEGGDENGLDGDGDRPKPGQSQ